MIVFKTFLTL